MIALFIDESGSFECNDKNYESLEDKELNEVIGGVLCFNLKNEDALNNVNIRLKREFIEVGGYDYYKKIHGRNRVGIIQNKLLKRVFEENQGYGHIVPFYIERGQISKNINSNITDDNTAAMLYFNMLNRLVSNILLYYPDFIEDNCSEDVHINIASRRTPFNKLNEKKKKEFISLGISVDQENQNSFKLNSSTSVLANISNELSNNNSRKCKININIREHNINYQGSDLGCNEMFQLADFVCNNAYLKVIDLPNRVIFGYDDIDDNYRRIYKNYKLNNLFEYINEKYNIEYLHSRNKYKKIYDKYLLKLDENKITKINSIKECMAKIEIIIHEKRYERKRMKYLVDFLQLIIDQLPQKYSTIKLNFYYLTLNVYNHIGDFNNNRSTYRKVISNAESVFSIEAINLKLKINNVYAVTKSNEFDFKQSLMLVEELIIIQEDIEKIFMQSNKLLFNTNKTSNDIVDLDMGKLYSSKGQYQAFILDNDAYESFHKALTYMGINTINKHQTISYFIHFLSESNHPINENDFIIIEDYFGSKNFMDILNHFNEVGEGMINIPVAFKLFAFIKLYINRLSCFIEDEKLKILVKRILKFDTNILEHPWGLIFFNLGKYFHTDTKLSKSLLDRAYNICNSSDNEVTLKLIAHMIKINSVRNKGCIKSFSEYLQEDFITEHMRDYFKLDEIRSGNLNLEEKIALVNSKFTYMYH